MDTLDRESCPEALARSNGHSGAPIRAALPSQARYGLEASAVFWLCANSGKAGLK